MSIEVSLCTLDLCLRRAGMDAEADHLGVVVEKAAKSRGINLDHAAIERQRSESAQAVQIARNAASVQVLPGAWPLDRYGNPIIPPAPPKAKDDADNYSILVDLTGKAPVVTRRRIGSKPAKKPVSAPKAAPGRDRSPTRRRATKAA